MVNCTVFYSRRMCRRIGTNSTFSKATVQTKPWFYISSTRKICLNVIQTQRCTITMSPRDRGYPTFKEILILDPDWLGYWNKDIFKRKFCRMTSCIHCKINTFQLYWIFSERDSQFWFKNSAIVKTKGCVLVHCFFGLESL